MLDADDVVGRRALRPESLIEPVQRRRDRAVLLAQALDQLHRKGGRQRGPLEAREAPGGRRHGPVVADAEQLVGQGVGFLAHRAPAHDTLGQAPEVLHQHDAQRDGYRPQLTDHQWLHALVGVHESTEHLGVEAAVGMRHEGPGDSVDSRIPGQWPLGQLGQLPIEPGREIVADLPQLLVDDVEVVDEPFGRRNDRPLLTDGVGDHPIRFAEDASVVLDARQQPLAPTRPRDDGLGGRQAFGVLLEALDAEELGADGVLDDRGGAQHADPHVVAPG